MFLSKCAGKQPFLSQDRLAKHNDGWTSEGDAFSEFGIVARNLCWAACAIQNHLTTVQQDSIVPVTKNAPAALR